MKINYYQTPKNPYFGNTMKQVIKNGEVVNRHYTRIFRDGKDFWQDVVEKIETRYPDGDVNLTCYGCSDNSEPATFVISMYEWAKKLMASLKPMRALDIEPDIIRQARTGICNIHEEDLEIILRKILRREEQDYFNVVERTDRDYDIGLQFTSKVMDKIRFGVADIFKDADKLNAGEKNGIFCRNFWNYIPREKQGQLAEKLHDKTKNNGFIVIGDYDIRKGVYDVLDRHHFRQSDDNPFFWYAK